LGDSTPGVYDVPGGGGDEPAGRTILARPGAPGTVGAEGDDRAHYLVVVEGAERGRRIELGGEPVVIGRSEPAGVVIADPLVSRSHCRVGLVMGEMFATDLGSSNGTFVAGRRISGSCLIAPGERIAIGTHVLEHEWRSRREVQSLRALDSDIEKANRYVRSLLPPPMAEGPVRTDWVLLPSARLGGDAFGYHFIDERTFAVYLLDVTGHGTDAAMHAVSVMNVLRQRAIPGVDVRDPGQMAAHVNEMFQMDRHGDMLLSLWYGVCDLGTRSLAFTSAGHHAAYLVGPEREGAVPLDVSNVLIGMVPGFEYRSARIGIPPGGSLFVFSDGAFEIETVDGRQWDIDDLVPLFVQPPHPGKTESQRILETVASRTGRQSFEDDFTLVVATFA
jgi:serine phosphatase RsbU (regulator of sigma subunit)